MKNLLHLLFLGYRRLISPLLGARCRFHPSCSHYSEMAIAEYGFCKGVWLTVKRLLRCQPFSAGGVDFPQDEL